MTMSQEKSDKSDLEAKLEQALAHVRAGKCDGLALICLTEPENGEEGFTYYGVLPEAVERMHRRIHSLLDSYHARYYQGGHQQSGAPVIVGDIEDLFRALGLEPNGEPPDDTKH